MGESMKVLIQQLVVRLEITPPRACPDHGSERLRELYQEQRGSRASLELWFGGGGDEPFRVAESVSVSTTWSFERPARYVQEIFKMPLPGRWMRVVLNGGVYPRVRIY